MVVLLVCIVGDSVVKVVVFSGIKIRFRLIFWMMLG